MRVALRYGDAKLILHSASPTGRPDRMAPPRSDSGRSDRPTLCRAQRRGENFEPGTSDRPTRWPLPTDPTPDPSAGAARPTDPVWRTSVTLNAKSTSHPLRYVAAAARAGEYPCFPLDCA